MLSSWRGRKGEPLWVVRATEIRMVGAHSGTLPLVAKQKSSWTILTRLVDATRRGRSETPVVVCIDVEPDPRVFDRADPPPWLGFERCLERLPQLRRRLAAITGTPAAFTWALRMDPQVEQTWGSAEWVAEAYGEALEEVVAEGD